MKKMEEPAKQALDAFYREEYDKKAKKAELEKEKSPELQAVVDAGTFVTELKKNRTQAGASRAVKHSQGQKLNLPVQFFASGMIDAVRGSTVQIDQSLVSLAPLETLTIFFMVCLVTGLVLASPWVFYQIWSFVAAGLYRHERRYVKKYLPFSLGLFLAGVFLCFLFVLPITLSFLLQFNVWLGVAPTLRLSEWMSFATILPLIFGLVVSDAAGHAVPGADQYLHRLMTSGQSGRWRSWSSRSRRPCSPRAKTRSACCSWPSP